METAVIFLEAAELETAKSILTNADTDADADADTTERILSGSNAFLKPINLLYDGAMQPQGDEMFDQIGYAPLRDYLENDNESLRNDAKLVLGDYAENTVRSIIEVVKEAVEKKHDFSKQQQHGDDDKHREKKFEPPSTLLLVAHAIYLPAAALGVASLLGCCDNSLIDSSLLSSSESMTMTMATETILSSNTKEAEGYLVDTEQQSVYYLSRDNCDRY